MFEPRSQASVGIVTVPGLDPELPSEGFHASLGLDESDRLSASVLVDWLTRVAFEFDEAVAPAEVQSRFVESVLFAPVVIVEGSPPVGRSLGTLAWSSSVAYLGLMADSPVLTLVWGGTGVVVWLISPVVQGAREGMQEAVRNVVRERIEGFLRGHGQRPIEHEEPSPPSDMARSGVAS